MAKSKPTPTPKQTAGISDAAVEKATGKTWAEWLKSLDAAGAKQMSHREIAAFLHDQQKCSPWWSQMITVGYEQARGRREKHQKPAGYSISASKTITVPVAQLFAACSDPKSRRRWLGAHRLAVHKTTANKSIRATWGDGATSLEVNFYIKAENKTQITVQHNKLSDAKAAQQMKIFWRDVLIRLKETLES